MKEKDIQYFKNKLEEEKRRLENELSNIAVRDPKNPEDWVAIGSDVGNRDADPNNLADSLEDMENNNAIVDKLEEELKQVNNSLQQIQDGGYGKCSVCGGMIEKDRLEANPSAPTCIKCMS